MVSRLFSSTFRSLILKKVCSNLKERNVLSRGTLKLGSHGDAYAKASLSSTVNDFHTPSERMPFILKGLTVMVRT